MHTKSWDTDIECSNTEAGCCGAPWLHSGDIKHFTKVAEKNVKILADEVRNGGDIVVPQPTCGYVLKKDYVDYVGLPNEMTALASKADVVVNTLPLTPRTSGVFDKAFFDAMKPTAHFINVGRGGSVVTMLCDGGERYLDSYYNDDWIAANGFDLAPYAAGLDAFMRTGEFPG